MDASPEIMKEFRAMTVGMADNWLEDVKDRKVNAKEALIELRSIARSHH